jgi:lipopolysaccharide/colanic/teichoic acid biosynthesis glycosyltransferase
MATIAYLSGESLFTRELPVWKRAIDIMGSLVGITVSAPIMLAIAAAIKLMSPGPVLFCQQRSGHGGKPFTFYKFRSMVKNADELKDELRIFNERQGPAFKMANDPRVTAVGRFIRKWSLDELPQFFNVLKGDMSLVGPRPLPCEETLRQDPWHSKRLEVTPGITCLWQVYARHDESFERWVRLDIEYASKQSLVLDLTLLLKTLPAVVSRRGAH